MSSNRSDRHGHARRSASAALELLLPDSLALASSKLRSHDLSPSFGGSCHAHPTAGTNAQANPAAV